MTKGINIGVDETCIPSKIYLGHIEWLIDRCDLILIPRIAEFSKGLRQYAAGKRGDKKAGSGYHGKYREIYYPVLSRTIGYGHVKSGEIKARPESA